MRGGDGEVGRLGGLLLGLLLGPAGAVPVEAGAHPHLSGGFETSAEVVHRLFDPLIEAASAMGAGLDWKTSLQELSAEHSLGVPEYVIADEGPDHMKTFTAQVRVGSGLYGHGTGRSKKEAEQQAAETAYLAIAAAHGDVTAS